MAWTHLGEPVWLPPEGALLTTIQFQALGETDSTLMQILESGGDPLGYTVVYDGEIPNCDVLGEIGAPAQVTIVPEPASLPFLALAVLAALKRRQL